MFIAALLLTARLYAWARYLLSPGPTIPPSGVFKGGGLCEAPPPFDRTAVIFVSILELFLAPFRDKIAATSDQMRFFGGKML